MYMYIYIYHHHHRCAWPRTSSCTVFSNSLYRRHDQPPPSNRLAMNISPDWWFKCVVKLKTHLSIIHGMRFPNKPSSNQQQWFKILNEKTLNWWLMVKNHVILDQKQNCDSMVKSCWIPISSFCDFVAPEVPVAAWPGPTRSRPTWSLPGIRGRISGQTH